MAGQFGLNVFQLAGVNVKLENPPWWVQGVLRWLYYVKSLQEAGGDYSGYRYRCRDYLDHKPPKDIYSLFNDYVNKMEHDEQVAASKRR